MAEILLSLTIIGVVAAITLPSLTGNINERTWNTQRKALYSRISQAISLMPALNGYGVVSKAIGTEGTDSYVPAVDTAAVSFITNGLAKVMKINNVCETYNITKCGIPKVIKPMGEKGEIIDNSGHVTGTYDKIDMDVFTNVKEYYPNVYGGFFVPYFTNGASFETANGESIFMHYNLNCMNFEDYSARSSGAIFPTASICINFIYDLNGTKGPNTFGKDIGIITVFNPSDPVVVAPMPFPSPLYAKYKGSQYISVNNMGSACTSSNPASRPPNVYEALALEFNNRLYQYQHAYYWTSTRVPNTTDQIYSYLTNGYIIKSTYDQNSKLFVRCIHR
ncbi:MAG: type II secretion system GspH family protein [Fusobacterium sp.]|nr:type II secretion system GspH family protein [Fusobacterium sp.]